jgi:hypothetical protein
MNTAQNIRRLELILASPFWRDNTRRYVAEKITLEITGQEGVYRWRLDDADDGGSYTKSSEPSPSLGAAKENMRRVLEQGLRRMMP